MNPKQNTPFTNKLSPKGNYTFLTWLLLTSKSLSDFLERLLKEKQSRRPRYSLRSLARELSLSPAMTSQLISGKRGASHEILAQISDKLELSPREFEFLELLSEVSRTRGKVKKTLEDQLYELRSVYLHNGLNPKFGVSKHRNEWYFWALYSAFGIDGIKYTVSEFSARFKLPIAIIQEVLDDLCRLGWIRPGLDEEYHLNEDAHLVYEPQTTPKDIWELRESVLKRITEKVLSQEKNQTIGVYHFAFHPHLLKQVNVEMDKFIARLKKLADPPQTTSDVYCAYVQIFRAGSD